MAFTLARQYLNIIRSLGRHVEYIAIPTVLLDSGDKLYMYGLPFLAPSEVGDAFVPELILDTFPDNNSNETWSITLWRQVLNLLFSVPTHKNLRKLQKALLKSNNRQNKVINLVENSLAIIINASHAQIQENRQMIQNLQDITRIFHEEIAAIKRNLRIVNFDSFCLHIANRRNNIFHTVYPLLYENKV